MTPYSEWAAKIDAQETVADVEGLRRKIGADAELGLQSQLLLWAACDDKCAQLRVNSSSGRDAKADGLSDLSKASGGESDVTPPAAQSPASPTPSGESMKSIIGEEDRAKAGTRADKEYVSPEIMEGALVAVRAQEDRAAQTAQEALAPIPRQPLTVEQIDAMADLAIARVKAFERVKKAILKEGRHYIIVCLDHPQEKKKPYVNHEKRPNAKDCGAGQVMMKKSGADTLGNGFGVSVTLLSDTLERDKEGRPIKAVVEVRAEWQGTQRFGRGTCTMDEILQEKGKTEHNLHEKAQTRAEKRGILAVLGSADPIADEE